MSTSYDEAAASGATSAAAQTPSHAPFIAPPRRTSLAETQRREDPLVFLPVLRQLVVVQIDREADVPALVSCAQHQAARVLSVLDLERLGLLDEAVPAGAIHVSRPTHGLEQLRLHSELQLGKLLQRSLGHVERGREQVYRLRRVREVDGDPRVRI